MSDWSLRSAVAEDYESWRNAYQQVASEGRWIGGEEVPSDEVMRPHFEAGVAAPDRLHVLAETPAGVVVGGLSANFVRRGVAEVGMLLIQGWRRRGIGSALIAACLDWSRAQNAHKVALEVWPHNAGAIALYRKFGFVEEGRLVRHYRRKSGELWDSLLMGLVLDQDSPGSPHTDAERA